MPSPLRLFRGMTVEQLTQLRASGFDRALYGTFTNLSGAGKSSSIENMSVETLLFEVNAELDILEGRSTRVYQRFGCGC